LLDSEPKPLADDVAIRIPSKDKPAQVERAPQAMPPVSDLAASTTLDPNEEVVEPSSPAPMRSQSAATPPAVAKDTTKELHAPKTPVAEKPQAPVAKAESKPVAKPEKADDSARALALLEGKTDIKPEKKASKFVIQVAALASKEKVNEVQTRLKDAGIKSYTQKVATGAGERIRIRVGPFASKDEADKIKAKIVKLGLNGTLVPA
jgi:DedD protein